MLRKSSIQTLMLSGVMAISSLAAQGDETPTGPPPAEGRIYNLDSKPFRFRLARKTGVTWTNEFTLAPGEVFTIRTGQSGEVNALEGITGDGKGHVTIEYPELAGKVRLRLPAVDVNRNLYIPYWFHVRDSNGFSRLVQARNKEEAEQQHQSLLAEPPLTDAELASVKRMLRANFVLYDK